MKSATAILHAVRVASAVATLCACGLPVNGLGDLGGADASTVDALAIGEMSDSDGSMPVAPSSAQDAATMSTAAGDANAGPSGTGSQPPVTPPPPVSGPSHPGSAPTSAQPSGAPPIAHGGDAGATPGLGGAPGSNNSGMPPKGSGGGSGPGNGRGQQTDAGPGWMACPPGLLDKMTGCEPFATPSCVKGCGPDLPEGGNLGTKSCSCNPSTLAYDCMACSYPAVLPRCYALPTSPIACPPDVANGQACMTACDESHPEATPVCMLETSSGTLDGCQCIVRPGASSPVWTCATLW